MPFGSEEVNAPIEVYADDSIIDGGVAAIPKMLLRFAKYLRCEGAGLNDRQVLLLVMVIALREDRNLRLSNLPMLAAISTLESDLGHLRKVGLVFTQRDYYPAKDGKPPRMRSQIWDIRSLKTNIAQVQRQWFAGHGQALQQWRSRNERGQRPVYELPLDYQQEVSVPEAVLRDIAAGRFFPVPAKWLKVAQRLPVTLENSDEQKRPLPTASKTGGRAFETKPTDHNIAGRQVEILPTATNTGDHLGTSSASNLESINLAEQVFAHFAKWKGRPYSPTGNDRKAVTRLYESGYTYSEIAIAIDNVFERGDVPKYFSYCAQIVRDHPPACPPNSLAEAHERSEESQPLPPELESLVNLGCSRDPRVVQQRLNLMLDLCSEAAGKYQSTGLQWVKAALERSLGKDDPLTYATAILRNWIEHGPDIAPNRQRPTRLKARQQAQPRSALSAQNWSEAIDA